MEELNIDKIKSLCNEGKMQWTNHVVIRLLKRRISQEDIEKVLMQGEIIEYYADDYPYSSCLIMGRTEKANYLHVVCGIGNGMVWIITAYEPDERKWEADYKTRKR